MPGLKIICAICTDEFRATDNITITSCGHLYHLICMMAWERISRICPQCRKCNPKKHKVFLNIEDHCDASPLGGNLNVNIHELHAKLQESERNFMHMQDQYTIEQDARKELEHRVASYMDNESNFLILQAQYSECENRNKILLEEIERVALENTERSTEISMLKEYLAVMKRLYNF